MASNSEEKIDDEEGIGTDEERIADTIVNVEENDTEETRTSVEDSGLGRSTVEAARGSSKVRSEVLDKQPGVIEDNGIQDVELEGEVEDSGIPDDEEQGSKRTSEELNVVEDSGIKSIEREDEIEESAENIEEQRSKRAGEELGVIEDSGIRDVELEGEIEDSGIPDDEEQGSKRTSEELHVIEDSGIKSLELEDEIEDSAENIEKQRSKRASEELGVIEDSGIREDERTSQKDSGLTEIFKASLLKLVEDIEHVDTDWQVERELPSGTVIDASTDRRSQSTTSKTDSEVYDHPIRMDNTQVLNTPSQEYVTVKFVTDTSVSFTYAFYLSSTVQEIKEQMSDVIKVDVKSIVISKDGFDVDDWLPLAGLGVEAFGCIELKITSTDPNQKITGIADDNVPTIDVITVHVLQDDGSFKDVIVEIHDEAYCKQWLGGHRNRKNNKEYHHACTQTLPRHRQVLRKVDGADTFEYFLFHRETQTPLKPKNVKIDTHVNKTTQMYRSDCSVPWKNDKIITAKEYENYDDWLKRSKILEKVIKIQNCYRNWSRRRHYNKLIDLQKQLMKEMHDQKLNLLHEQIEKKRQMISGAAFPTKRNDFYMLYLMVGKWWQKEWQRIKDLRTEEPKKAEYCALLEKEITLLSAIEKHRIEVKKESLRRQEMRFLEMNSRPIIFRNANGGMTSIDNPATQKAREFKEMYSTLISNELSPKERIDFLLTLKNVLSSYKEYEYAKDIVVLIEREINLHVIGLKGDELNGIRKRIEQLFMYFLQQPQFNPNATKYRKPNWPKTVDILYKCTRCFKLLPVSGYPVHTRMEKIAVCKSCEWLQNIGHQRIDMSPYLRMLKQIQNSEMENCCYSSICFVLQQTGAYFLVNTIWHGHSAISESRVLSNLRLVRWIKEIEWSPWNTILLTEEEAKCHNSIENVMEFYDQSFIDSVRQKHILARVHFISLLKTDYHLRSTGAWENITDSGPYLHPSHIDAFVQSEETL